MPVNSLFANLRVVVKPKVLAFLAAGLFAAEAGAEGPPVLKTQADKVNYAIGVNMAGNLKRQGVDINPDLVIRGMKDAFSGGALLLTDAELRDAMGQYINAVRRKQAAKAGIAAPEKNRKDGKALPAGNK